jgi:hypothetical protein
LSAEAQRAKAEAIYTFFFLCAAPWIASLALAMTKQVTHSRDLFPRDDGPGGIRATRWLAMTVRLFEIESNDKPARRPAMSMDDNNELNIVARYNLSSATP